MDALREIVHLIAPGNDQLEFVSDLQILRLYSVCYCRSKSNLNGGWVSREEEVSPHLHPRDLC